MRRLTVCEPARERVGRERAMASKRERPTSKNKTPERFRSRVCVVSGNQCEERFGSGKLAQGFFVLHHHASVIEQDEAATLHVAERQRDGFTR